MNKKIILCSGGTGGHVIPAVKFGNFLIDEGYDCILIIDKRGMKYTNLFKGSINIIHSSHLSGNILFKIKSIFQLICGFFQSFIIFIKFKPKNVISFGGYATSIPLFVTLIFKLFIKINVHIHEQNSIIGRVNYLFLPIVKNCFTNFNIVKKIDNKYFKKTHYVGLPVYSEILKKELNIKKINKKISIFVSGGSQGSISVIKKFVIMLSCLNLETINKIYLFIQAPKIIQKELQITLTDMKLDFEIKDFYNNINEILSFVDLAITRAGAGTINDLIKNLTPAIIIPLANSVDNHQYYNAKYLSDKNAAILLDEINFDFTNSDVLMKLINDKDKRNIIINQLSKIIIPNTNTIMLSNIKK